MMQRRPVKRCSPKFWPENEVFAGALESSEEATMPWTVRYGHWTPKTSGKRRNDDGERGEDDENAHTLWAEEDENRQLDMISW